MDVQQPAQPVQQPAQPVQQPAQPVQQPAFVGTFETGRHYKVHKSYIWLGSVAATTAVILVFLANAAQGIVQLAQVIARHGLVNPGGHGLLVGLLAVLAILVAYALVMGVYALGWRFMSYVFDAREFSFYSGFITKRRVHVPYARVQSVNQRASIFQRLVGVCTVTIDSAGGSQNKAVRIPYVRLEAAERMRVELFMRKAAVAVGAEAAVLYDPRWDPTTPVGAAFEVERLRAAHGAPVPPAALAGQGTPATPAAAPAAAAAAPAAAPAAYPPAPAAAFAPAAYPGAPVPGQNILDAASDVAEWRGVFGGVADIGMEPTIFEMGLSNRELAFTALSHSTPIVLGITLALCVGVTLFGIGLDISNSLARAVAAFTIPAAVITLLVAWIVGAGGIALSYGRFRTRRRGSRIEVERGLLARVSAGIDIERVQSIEIRQSFIRRIMGYCEVSLGRIGVNEGGDSNNKTAAEVRGLVVHPFVKLDRVDAIVRALVPELAGYVPAPEAQPLPRVALRRSVLRRAVWCNAWFYVALVVLAAWLVTRAAIGASATPAYEASVLRGFLNAGLAAALAVCAAGTVWGVADGIIWARKSRFAWNRGFVTLYNDGLSTRLVAVPRRKVQSGYTRSNPFQRASQVTRLVVVTAAGTHSTTAQMMDVPAEAGDAFLRWLE